MLVESSPLFFLVFFRVAVEAELHGAAEYGFWFKLAVGLGHNLAIHAAWRVRCRCAVVFYGFLHHTYLFGREPPLQPCVGGEYLAAREVVYGARPFKAEVVVGCGDVSHVNVGPDGFGQLHRLVNDMGDVWQAVRFVEACVAWQNLCLDKRHQVKADVVIHIVCGL